MITGIIPQQNFELVDARIAEILTAELGSQGAMYSPEEVFVKRVFLEKFIPPDITEMPCLNVTMGQELMDNKDQRQEDGTATYYIAAYASAKTSTDGEGDKRATQKLHRILGLCRAILENSEYRTLGFTPSEVNVKHTNVVSITIPKVEDINDSTNTIFGYLEFRVKMVEDVIVKEPIPIQSAFTTVKLYDTEQGYFYEYQKP